jgi:hypothetical protein
MKMVTKEEVEKAKAAYDAAYVVACDAAWEARVADAASDNALDNYIKLKEAYENGN